MPPDDDNSDDLPNVRHLSDVRDEPDPEPSEDPRTRYRPAGGRMADDEVPEKRLHEPDLDDEERWWELYMERPDAAREVRAASWEEMRPVADILDRLNR